MRQPSNATSLRFALLLLAACALGACGGEPGPGDDAATDAVEDSAGTPDTAADDVEPVDAGTPGADAGTMALPGWFPEDVYLPGAYTVVGAMDVGDVQRLELRVDGSVADVAAQAAAAMQANGWGEGVGDGESMAYTQGDRSAMLTINARDDGAVRVGYQFMTL